MKKVHRESQSELRLHACVKMAPSKPTPKPSTESVVTLEDWCSQFSKEMLVFWCARLIETYLPALPAVAAKCVSTKDWLKVTEYKRSNHILSIFFICELVWKQHIFISLRNYVMICVYLSHISISTVKFVAATGLDFEKLQIQITKHAAHIQLSPVSRLLHKLCTSFGLTVKENVISWCNLAASH